MRGITKRAAFSAVLFLATLQCSSPGVEAGVTSAISDRGKTILGALGMSGPRTPSHDVELSRPLLDHGEHVEALPTLSHPLGTPHKKPPHPLDGAYKPSLAQRLEFLREHRPPSTTQKDEAGSSWLHSHGEDHQEAEGRAPLPHALDPDFKPKAEPKRPGQCPEHCAILGGGGPGCTKVCQFGRARLTDAELLQRAAGQQETRRLGRQALGIVGGLLGTYAVVGVTGHAYCHKPSSWSHSFCRDMMTMFHHGWTPPGAETGARHGPSGADGHQHAGKEAPADVGKPPMGGGDRNLAKRSLDMDAGQEQILVPRMLGGNLEGLPITEQAVAIFERRRSKHLARSAQGAESGSPAPSSLGKERVTSALPAPATPNGLREASPPRLRLDHWPVQKPRLLQRLKSIGPGSPSPKPSPRQARSEDNLVPDWKGRLKEKECHKPEGCVILPPEARREPSCPDCKAPLKACRWCKAPLEQHSHLHAPVEEKELASFGRTSPERGAETQAGPSHSHDHFHDHAHARAHDDGKSHALPEQYSPTKGSPPSRVLGQLASRMKPARRAISSQEGGLSSLAGDASGKSIEADVMGRRKARAADERYQHDHDHGSHHDDEHSPRSSHFDEWRPFEDVDLNSPPRHVSQGLGPTVAPSESKRGLLDSLSGRWTSSGRFRPPKASSWLGF